MLRSFILPAFPRPHQRYVALFSITTAMASFAFCNPAGAKTLEEAMSFAVYHHPKMEAAEANTGLATRQRLEEFSAYLPVLSVNAMGGRLFGDNSTSRGLSVTRGQGYSGTWEGNVALRQNFYDGGERKNRVRSAKMREKAADANELDVREVISATVARVYINLLSSYRIIAMIQDHQHNLEDYINRLKSGVDEGAIDEGEYRQAANLRLYWSDVLSTYEGQLKTAKAAYYEIVGEEPSGEMATPLLPDYAIPENVDEALYVLRETHPALRNSAYTVESLEKDIAAQRAAFLPDVSGELSYTKSDKKDLLGGELEDAHAYMRLSWSFDAGGAVFHRVEQSKFQHEASIAQQRDLQRTLERDLKIAYAEYESAISQLQTQNQRLEIGSSLFQTTKEQFEGARSTLLELAQADNLRFQSQLDQVSAQDRVLLAQYGILYSMGQTSALLPTQPNQE